MKKCENCKYWSVEQWQYRRVGERKFFTDQPSYSCKHPTGVLCVMNPMPKFSCKYFEKGSK